MNEDLVLAYRTIRQQVELLIERLQAIERLYQLLDVDGRSEFFYETRKMFNQRRPLASETAPDEEAGHVARLIFLNRTCFQRPLPRQFKWRIQCAARQLQESQNLRRGESALGFTFAPEYTNIRFGDFTACREFVDENTFVYLDPPYRPISKTANFNSFYRSPFR